MVTVSTDVGGDGGYIKCVQTQAADGLKDT